MMMMFSCCWFFFIVANGCCCWSWYKICVMNQWKCAPLFFWFSPSLLLLHVFPQPLLAVRSLFPDPKRHSKRRSEKRRGASSSLLTVSHAHNTHTRALHLYYRIRDIKDQKAKCLPLCVTGRREPSLLVFFSLSCNSLHAFSGCRQLASLLLFSTTRAPLMQFLLCVCVVVCSKFCFLLFAQWVNESH